MLIVCFYKHLGVAVLALAPWAELQQIEAGYQVNQGAKVTDACKFAR